MSSKTWCWSIHCASVMPSRSFRSAPAQNARSPEPVRITQRTSASSVVTASVSSRAISVLKALDASGRSNAITSTCSAGRDR